MKKSHSYCEERPHLLSSNSFQAEEKVHRSLSKVSSGYENDGVSSRAIENYLL